MFLKIQYHNTGQETVQECEGILKVGNTIEIEPRRLSFEFSKGDNVSIYLMNNDGKTIDSYQF